MIWLIIILCILLFLVGVLFSFLLISYIKKQNIKKLSEKTIDFINTNKLDDADATLNRVNEIASSNNKYRELSSKIYQLHEVLETSFNRIRRIYSDIQLTSDIKKIKTLTKEATDKIVQFEKDYEIFLKTSSQVTHQDEYLRNKFSFLQGKVREVTEFYKEKRIVLERIHPQVDSLRSEIKLIEKEFQKVIKKMDVDKADHLLREYTDKTIIFARIIDEAPSIITNLFTIIPNTVESLKSHYINKKKELKHSLDHIDFKNTIYNIAKKYNKAKESFLELRIDETEDRIIEILRSFKTIEKSINYEIESRNKFVKIYEPTIKEIKKSLENFISLKKQFNKLSDSTKKLTPEIFDSFQSVNKMFKDIDNQGLKYRELMMSPEIAYSVKISKTNFIHNLLVDFIDKMNSMMEQIWSLNLESSIIKNKFYRSDAAMNELVANIKEERIAITNQEKLEFDKLNKYKSEISFKLQKKDDIDIETKEKISIFSDRVTHFYAAISGKMQIALHVKNMLKELAPSRSSNQKLNFGLQIAEKNYVDGKYHSALNKIIDTISGDK